MKKGQESPGKAACPQGQSDGTGAPLQPQTHARCELQVGDKARIVAKKVQIRLQASQSDRCAVTPLRCKRTQARPVPGRFEEALTPVP